MGKWLAIVAVIVGIIGVVVVWELGQEQPPARYQVPGGVLTVSGEGDGVFTPNDPLSQIYVCRHYVSGPVCAHDISVPGDKLDD